MTWAEFGSFLMDAVLIVSITLMTIGVSILIKREIQYSRNQRSNDTH